jgi:hypothetical protein
MVCPNGRANPATVASRTIQAQTRLSAQDMETICAAAREADAHAADRR